MGDISRPPGGGTGTLKKPKHRVKKPQMYKVVLLNDDFTPRDFVVEVLVTVFRKNRSDANRIMMTAHQGGKSIVGLYTYDIATTKVSQARNRAKEAGYPLRFVVEGA
jgi:ATP-dependent Clp protease adaptor protein ClpS